MASSNPATTIRFTEDDREVLDKLRKMTGLDSATAIIRVALREALVSRQRKAKR